MPDQIDKFDAAVSELAERIAEIKSLCTGLNSLVKILMDRLQEAERMVEALEK